MTQVLDKAANVIRERLDEITEELARYDDLRTERKELEAALKRLTPKERSARSTIAAGSLSARIVDLVGGTAEQWTIPEIAAGLGLEGGDLKIAGACSKLHHEGRIARVGRGIYKAA